jgi:hypothetical protein
MHTWCFGDSTTAFKNYESIENVFLLVITECVKANYFCLSSEQIGKNVACQSTSIHMKRTVYDWL